MVDIIGETKGGKNLNRFPNYRSGDASASNRPSEDRYFNLDDHWYFTTREGITMGPYDSRAQAIAETNLYIEFINSAKSPVLKVIKREQLTIAPE